MQWEVGAATTTGVSETNPYGKDYSMKSSLSGLVYKDGLTILVLYVLVCLLITLVRRLILLDNHEGPKTNEVQEAEESLRNLRY